MDSDRPGKPGRSFSSWYARWGSWVWVVAMVLVAIASIQMIVG
ncbi:MAG TPA: hypothetical protein VEC19_12865 [Usitatibacter sp.]|nr:hypothetical protein [Usitatibacter sp.]